jgi:hypothetical protein
MADGKASWSKSSTPLFVYSSALSAHSNDKWEDARPSGLVELHAASNFIVSTKLIVTGRWSTLYSATGRYCSRRTGDRQFDRVNG